MDTGHIIAINLTLLYCILGPPVLFAVYVILDRLARGAGKQSLKKTDTRPNGPALWSTADVDAYIRRK